MVFVCVVVAAEVLVDGLVDHFGVEVVSGHVEVVFFSDHFESPVEVSESVEVFVGEVVLKLGVCV